MPSLGDVVNEVKSILDNINTNTLGTRNNTGTIINQLTQLDADVQHINTTDQQGFTNLAQGMAVLIQLQAQNNNLLAANDKQNETIICWLYNIANVLCDIKRNTDTEVQLQKNISAALAHANKILELVHAREAIEVERQDAIEQRMDKCCPKPEPPVQPCFKECEPPRLPDYNPIKIDWKPVHYQTQAPPIG